MGEGHGRHVLACGQLAAAVAYAGNIHRREGADLRAPGERQPLPPCVPGERLTDLGQLRAAAAQEDASGEQLALGKVAE